MYQDPTLNRLVNCYGMIQALGSNLQSLFLLWMRLTWGHQFILIGLTKINHIPETVAFFHSHHISHPEFYAYLVGYTELIGGALLFMGLLSRLVAIPLTIVMIAALSYAHSSVFTHFNFIVDPSSLVHEAPYPFLITCILILCFGPGRISVDAWIERWVSRQPTY